MEQENKYLCYDCGKQLDVNESEIKDGFMLEYNVNGEKLAILKCKECYEKDPSLKNYQGCEVYSRIVGYIRPVNQWNEGKKQEFIDRKTFNINK